MQFKANSSCPVACYLGEEADPHLATTCFQMVVEGGKVSPGPQCLESFLLSEEYTLWIMSSQFIQENAVASGVKYLLKSTR